MKGYLKILLVLLLAVGLASCEDDQERLNMSLPDGHGQAMWG